MVRAIEHEQESYRSRLFHFKGTMDNSSRHAKSLSIESAGLMEAAAVEDKKAFRSQPGKASSERPLPICSALNRNDKAPRRRLAKDESALAGAEAKEEQLKAEMEQMKERFAKLLLGEDMSGGGKGVSSALALSNAITNLAASAFGEQRRLEPMAAERKERWRKEIGWLLSVTDHIVEFAPSQQTNKDGTSMEIMTTRQRTDLLMNIPALKKLDAMLIDCLDNFQEQNEFSYVSRDSPDSEKGNVKRNDEKWWLPTVKVPPNGLSDRSRRFLQNQKDSVNQVLKAAMAINAQVLSEMEIPESYIEALPKNGRACLGDVTYRMITVEFFDPDQFLIEMDLSSEHKILDLKNRIEGSIVIWKRKMVQKDMKSPWGSAVSLEKREQFEERAQTILLLLKQGFPGISQSALDISKIQFNRDVGQAVLESYSRVLESLAHTVLSRIEDVLYADKLTQDPSNAVCERNVVKETEKLKETSNDCYDEMLASKTLLDFMKWDSDRGIDNKSMKERPDDLIKDDEDKLMSKVTNILTNKKSSYLETLGAMRSPTARYS